MSAFLYACKVQSIGDFIFSSNVLKEIIGASELIKCVENLAKPDKSDRLVFTSAAKAAFGFEGEPQIILAAAGNLRVIFKNEADLAKIVREMPRFIAKNAYGLKLAQAALCYDESVPNAYQKASGELEMRLKSQKSVQNHPLDFAFALLKQSPKTALPLFALNPPHKKCDETSFSQGLTREKCDKSTALKLRAFEKVKENDQNSIYELAKLGNDKNKIALIYADGNGLGRLIKDLNADELSHFSRELDRATKDAFKCACEQVKRGLGENLRLENLGENSQISSANSSKNSRSQSEKSEFKIREIICGGDDLVVICNANIALPLTAAFLEHFERLSKGILSRCGCENLGEKFGENAGKSANLGENADKNSNLSENSNLNANFAEKGANSSEKFSPNADKAKNSKEKFSQKPLTACAGIAFSNEKFPIHYALALAKDLCAHAKAHSKALDPHAPPSSLLFHNIQASMVRGYADIIERELTLGAHLGVNFGEKSVNFSEKFSPKAGKSANSSENSGKNAKKCENLSENQAVRCDFGAYFLKEQAQAVPLIADFIALVEAFREDKSPTSRLREWLNMLEYSPELAANELECISTIYADFARENEEKFRALHSDLSLLNLQNSQDSQSPQNSQNLQKSQGLIVCKDEVRETPIYDILSLISITKNVFGDESKNE